MLESEIMILENHFDQIIKQLEKRKKDVFDYLEISEIYNSNQDIRNNEYFKHKYKSFYVMNSAGLTEEYFNKYFEELNTRKYNSKNSLSVFLNKLNGIPTRRAKNSLQFAFATKALHTTNYKLPIYDNLIGRFFNILQPNDLLINFSERINNRQALYDSLINKFNELLLSPGVINLISSARKELSEVIKDDRILLINDLKMLDFIIWSFEQVKK